MPANSAIPTVPLASTLINGTPEISFTLNIVPVVRLLLIENSCPDVPSNESELSLNTFKFIWELPELKNPSENVEEPVLPNVPLVKLSAPEIPTPEPNLAFPLTPIPPTTVKAPVVEDVD